MQAYLERIRSIHRQLGIPESYEQDYQIPMHKEADDLVEIERDIYERPQFLVQPVAELWHAMQSAAAADGIQIDIVSAFRSVAKQEDIIRNKLAAGNAIDDILRVCAAPGYSEHHTGRAVDIATSNNPPLTEEFEKTQAFAWLQENAQRFSFALSYPRDTQRKIIYEPWHWANL